jgi:2-polyprenyl-6-methoxyphenol hydroxylase-like FAD-dependent oxidoreductase
MGDLQTITARSAIVGGGPAGIVAGYLFARAGIETVILEKHADFLRDFRGDTVHPSTMRIMEELGLLADFLKRPHQKLDKLEGVFGDKRLRIADLRRLNISCPYIAFMPQWEFLNFMAEKGNAIPGFKLLMQTEATDLIQEQGRFTGIRATTPNGPLTIKADLIIGADGRHSMTRPAAGLEVQDIGAPIDVLWFRIAREPNVADEVFAYVRQGHMLVAIDRGEYWQCAYVIPKGAIDRIKAEGLPAFRRHVVETAPVLAPHIDDIKDWDDIKLLTVAIDRLTRWSRPGLLCIGDAAHAMSPVGGVGINLAVQDAVAAVNILAPKLMRGPLSESDLDLVRQRRLFPAKVIQALQVQMQNRILSPVVSGKEFKIPAFLRLIGAVPWLQGVIASIIGIGVRPEHVKSC